MFVKYNMIKLFLDMQVYQVFENGGCMRGEIKHNEHISVNFFNPKYHS